MNLKNTTKKTVLNQETDSAIDLIIKKERARQESELNLIASENYAPHAVMDAMGSVLTNKYAEGYPGKRYYGGCSVVDEAERLAIERAQQLFGAEHVNVQPHSGSSANMAVYHTILKPGDTILGMQLIEGGHLTHGHNVNFSGTLYNAVSYGVNHETGQLDYDAIEKLAVEHAPKLIIAGASAYSKTIDFERFSAIAKKVNAYFMADIAHIAGFVATGLHPSPFPYADFVTTTTHKTLRGPRGGMIMCKKEFATALDKTIMPGLQGGPLMHTIAAKAVAFGLALKPEFKDYQKQVLANARSISDTLQSHGFKIVSNGTDTHLFIVDVRSKNMTGKQAELILDSIGITVNRNCIPGEQEKPWITSGIRIGTPSITTRGMQEKEAQEIAEVIAKVLSSDYDESIKIKLHNRVKALCAQFPIYP